jgi:ABC-2 type transport system ATP-binding protein
VSNIGVVFGQKSQLCWDLPVLDSFELLKHIYKIPEVAYRENLQMFSELLDMSSFIEQPVRQLSLGQRMRADIAAALLHSPALIFFDEPTIGLDVLAKERIREFVRFMNREKKVTMIFTTHDMKDIEATCDRMMLIDKGKLIYDGRVEGIADKSKRERKLIVDFDKDYQFEPIERVQIEDVGQYRKSFTFNCDDVALKDLVGELSAKYGIIDFTVKEMEIETVVRKVYQGEITLQ